MGFLSPQNLLFALSVGILLAIYLRARARPTLDVSSLMLFDEAPAPVQRVRFLRLDPLFWLEACALAFLTLAIAGLYLMMPPSGGPGRVRALVFSLGAAMSAEESGRTRFDQAKRDALAVVASAAEGDRFSVIGYALEARVYHPPSSDHESVARAVRSLRPMAVGVRPAAVTAALMRARGAAEVNLFSDRAPPESALAALDRSARFNFRAIGASDDNLALVSLDHGVPGAAQGRAVIRNFSRRPRLAEFVVTLEGFEIHRAPLTLGPGEQLVVPFGPLLSGGVVEAKITSADALAADNVRFTHAPMQAKARALVLSPDRAVRDDFARVLLGVNPNFIIESVEPAAFRADPAADPYELAIVHDADVSGVHSRALLHVYPPEGDTIAGLAIERSVPAVKMNARDGAVFTLGPVRVAAAPEWMDVLLAGAGVGDNAPVPLAAVGERAGQTLGLLAFDVRGHLLLDPDKLDALLATLDLIRRMTAPRDVRVVATGDYLDVPVTGTARVIGPDGSASPVQPDPYGRVRVRPLDAGQYRVESESGTVRIFANYFDAEESNLGAARLPAQPTVAAPSGADRPSPAYEPRPITSWLIALALALVAIESVLLVRHAARWGMTHV